jgi:hypothetical protein
MIEAPDKKTTLVYRDGSTADIIKALLSVTPQAVKQMEDFAAKNYKGSVLDYVKFTANYIKKNFTYLKDGYKNQNIKLPARLNDDKTGDCKSFSLFFAAAMTAAGIKNGYRFISYDQGPPTHVYNYVVLNDGKSFPVDNCLKNFFSETQYKSKMNVNVLSEPEIGRRSRSERKAARQERRSGRQERRSERKENRQEKRSERKAKRKENKPFKKVALAPARGAMLLLVSLNVRNWAVKLSKMKRQDVEAFWKRLGGNVDKLYGAINKGKDKRRILGPEDPSDYAIIPSIGEPVSATAALTTAAPIILALVKLFKSKGVSDQDDQKTESEIEQAGVEPLGEGFQAEDPHPGTEKTSAGYGDPVKSSRTESSGSGSGEGSGSGSGSGLVLPLAAGAALLLLSR